MSKDENPNLAGIEMQNDFGIKQTMWVGYCVKGKQHNYFQQLKMYDAPPHSKNIANPNTTELQQLQVDRELNKDFNMSSLKEHDLLLLSHEKITIKDKHDLQRITSVEHLRSFILRQGAMLALVT